MGWAMCFLLMTFVPVQKLCVNIYIYTYICIPHTSSVIGRIYTYTRSVVQRWWSCTPSQSIGLFWGSGRFLCWMPFFLFSLVFPFQNSLMLECLWPLVFVSNSILTLGIFGVLQSLTSQEVFAPGPSFRISDSTWCRRTPLCHISLLNLHILQGVSGLATDCSCGVWCRGLTTCLLYVGPLFGNRLLNNSWAVALT